MWVIKSSAGRVAINRSEYVDTATMATAIVRMPVLPQIGESTYVKPESDTRVPFFGHERHAIRQREWRWRRREDIELIKKNTHCCEKTKRQSEVANQQRVQHPFELTLEENLRKSSTQITCSICGRTCGPFAHLDYLTMIHHAYPKKHNRLGFITNRNKSSRRQVSNFYGFT